MSFQMSKLTKEEQQKWVEYVAAMAVIDLPLQSTEDGNREVGSSGSTSCVVVDQRRKLTKSKKRRLRRQKLEQGRKINSSVLPGVPMNYTTNIANIIDHSWSSPESEEDDSPQRFFMDTLDLSPWPESTFRPFPRK